MELIDKLPNEIVLLAFASLTEEPFNQYDLSYKNHTDQFYDTLNQIVSPNFNKNIASMTKLLKKTSEQKNGEIINKYSQNKLTAKELNYEVTSLESFIKKEERKISNLKSLHDKFEKSLENTYSDYLTCYKNGYPLFKVFNNHVTKLNSFLIATKENLILIDSNYPFFIYTIKDKPKVDHLLGRKEKDLNK